MTRNWQVTETTFNPARQGHMETIFTTGNGYLGVRGSLEESHPGDDPLCLLHGVFNQPAGASVPELAPAPDWMALALTINGHLFRLDTGTILGYERVLDLQTATLHRAVLWQAPDGTICRLGFERFASLADPHLLALRITVHALNRSVDLRVGSAWGQPDADHWQNVRSGHNATADTATLSATTTQSGYRLGMAACTTLDGIALPADGEGAMTGRVTLAQDAVATLTRLVALSTSRDTGDPLAAAGEVLQRAAAAGYDALHDEHRTAWEAVWRHSDIEIEGDDFAQLAIRFALYHLIIAAPRHEDRASIGAKTLSGRGYKGHVFWDTELFALTPFIYTQPEVARNLLMYRYHLLDGARQKAADEGFAGAMYPWESTDTGLETTPKWSDPHPETGERERIWTGDHEIHISADIAHAVMTYWQVTGDDAFMRDYGAEMVLDTAVFWGSRAEFNAEQGCYEFNRVIGPDEYHENINNSAFTNWMVRWHLRQALLLLDWLWQHAPDRATSLQAQLDLTPKRLAHWQDVIERIRIPHDGDLLIQFDGFFELDAINVKGYHPRTHSLQAIFGTRAVNRSQIIKQADVVMLLALMGEQVGPPALHRANWDVYEPRCDHGSSLSAAMHALEAARLGMIDTAYDYWITAANADLADNKGNTADGIHAANCGGVWQAVVLGMAGLRVTADGLQVVPNLPTHWQRLRFPVTVRGQRQRVTITPDGATITEA